MTDINTSLLLAIHVWMISGESLSRAVCLDIGWVQDGVELTTPMLGPKSVSCCFLSLPRVPFKPTLTTTVSRGDDRAIAVAVREVRVSVRARNGDAWRRRVRFHVEYWLWSSGCSERRGRGNGKGKAHTRLIWWTYSLACQVHSASQQVRVKDYVIP